MRPIDALRVRYAIIPGKHRCQQQYRPDHQNQDGADHKQFMALSGCNRTGGRKKAMGKHCTTGKQQGRRQGSSACRQLPQPALAQADHGRTTDSDRRRRTTDKQKHGRAGISRIASPMEKTGLKKIGESRQTAPVFRHQQRNMPWLAQRQNP